MAPSFPCISEGALLDGTWPGKEGQYRNTVLHCPSFEIHPCFPFILIWRSLEQARAAGSTSPSLPSHSSSLGSAVSTETVSPKTSCTLTGFNSENISRFFYPILTWEQRSQRLFPKWGSELFPPSLGPSLAFALLEGHYQATSRFVWGYNCSWIFVPCNQKGLR